MNLNIFRSLLLKGIRFPEPVTKLLESTFTYTIDLTTCRWDIMMKDINKLFPRLPKSGETFTVEYSRNYNDRNTCEDDGMTSMPGKFMDWTIYHGTILILTEECMMSKERTVSFIKITCPNTKKDIANLHHLLKVLVKRSDDYKDRDTKKTMSVIGDIFTSETRNNRRKLDTVFIPHDKKTLIVDSINKFINNRAWYEKHSIPYHFGLLLYGPPGTGKSSIIKALTEEFNANVIYMKGMFVAKTFRENTGGWIHNVNGSVKPSFVIIEDIDKTASMSKPVEITDDMSPVEQKDVMEKAITSKVMLGEIMNVIDGVNSPENVIWIFTTNYIDNLEPALIRPGRIDLQVEIDYITNETFNEFLLHHFSKGLPNGYEVAGGHTFAEIQTDVMTGNGFDEIIEKYCNQED